MAYGYYIIQGMAKRKYSQDQLLGPPPEPQGILGKAASVGLSGIQYAGNLLDTPGAMVRNTIAGQNPLTPLMHPLSGEGRVGGRDLLRSAGLVGKKDTWGNWAAGTALDVALDPTTYLSFGASALTKGGRVAKSIGALDKASDVATAAGRAAGKVGMTQTVGRGAARASTTLRQLLNHGDITTRATRMSDATNAASKMGISLDDVLDQRLGGVANFGVPGFGKATLGASDAGADFMEGIGKAAMSIPGANVVASGLDAGKRVVKGLFHGPSGGKFDKYGQAISEVAHEHLPPGKRRVLQQELDLSKEFVDLHDAYQETIGGGAASTGPKSSGGWGAGDWVRARDRGNYGKVVSFDDANTRVHFTNPHTGATAEMDLSHDQLSPASVNDVPAGERFTGDPAARFLDRLVRYTAESRSVDMAIERLAKGKPIAPEIKSKIEELSKHFVDSKDHAWNQNFEMGGKGGLLEAEDNFQHFPGYQTPRGDTGVADVFRVTPTGHPSVHGREELTRGLYREQVNQLGMDPKYRGNLPTATKNILDDFGDRLGYTTKAGEDISPEKHAEELALHVSGLGKDWVDKSKRLFDNMTIHDWGKYVLAAEKRNASFRAIHEVFSKNVTDAADAVPLAQAFQRAGLDPERAFSFFQKASGLSDEALATAKIPRELVDAASAVVKTYETPEWSNIVTKTLDTVNRYFKPGMILVKPSFWFRNHTSGQFANMVSGYIQNPSDVATYLSSYKKARDLRMAGDAALRDELKVMGVMGADSTLDANAHILGGKGSPVHDPLPPSALDIGASSKEVWSGMAAQPNPTNPVLNALASATSGIRHKAGTWMETNAKANRVVEYQNRVSLYLYLKEKGYSPEAAAKAVNEVHFDYSKGSLAPFERDVMQRVVSFYIFSRFNIPWTIERLMQHPGGGMAQTIKAAGKAHSKDELTPEHISETASIPLGQNSEGAGRYLTGFGLGFEDPASFAVPSLKQNGLEVLSRTSPLIKGPLEYFTGQSFFQKGPHGGRDLEDLDPVIGRTLGNIGQVTGLRNNTSPVKYPGSGIIEHIASNSPFSGLLTGLRTATDPRKGIGTKLTNLTTGFRVSDVSRAAQDKELMNRVSKLERAMGGRSFSISYMPKDKKDELTEQQQRDYTMLKELKRLLNERSKARKAAEK